MGLKENILGKVKDIVNTKFETTEVDYVPTLDNSKLTFGNKGLRFKATSLFIDVRGSTNILNSFNKTTVAKIHKAYYLAIVNIAKDTGGEVRSFNGDSLLVFYQGNTKNSLSNAVKAAMNMKYMLDHDEGVEKYLKNYTSLDFGIGIGHGSILCAKVGVGGTYDNKDLIWIGNAVNRSAKLSDQAKSPSHIYISADVYSNLEDRVKYKEKKDTWGNPYKVDMWHRTTFNYNNSSEYCYYTNYWWTI